MQLWMWIAAGASLIAFELATTNLVLASLGVSALAGGVANWLGADALIQAFVFAIVAAVTLGLVRPIAIRNLSHRSPGLSTNVDRLMQSDALTLTEVTERSGQVKLHGEVWTARTMAGSIPAGLTVTIVSIDGATAVVRAKEAHS